MILRGIERRQIFRDDIDRADLLDRLERTFPECELRAFAWSFMPNHVHLVLQTGRVPLARAMARVGTGYALAFNRRHDRVGYLFQNRYKSLDVEDDEYLRTLVCYVHLNPLRAGLATSLEALSRYPWSGHAALLGSPPAMFHDVQATLALFASQPKDASLRLLEWMRGPQPSHRPAGGTGPGNALDGLVADVAREFAIDARRLRAGARTPRMSTARAVVVHRACDGLGLSQVEVAAALGLSAGGVSRARRRGVAITARLGELGGPLARGEHCPPSKGK